jgi:hypothetical protein
MKETWPARAEISEGGMGASAKGRITGFTLLDTRPLLLLAKVPSLPPPRVADSHPNTRDACDMDNTRNDKKTPAQPRGAD